MRILGKRNDRGANLVEFAITMPLLVLLLFGIVEFGWGLAQHVDVRHKAREALRLVIVDEPLSDVVARVCTDDIVDSDSISSLEVSAGTDVGDAATVTLVADVQQVTGLFSAFWGPNPTISSSVEGRVEQPPSFSPTTQTLTDPCP